MSYDTPQDPMTVSTHGTTPTPAPTPRTDAQCVLCNYGEVRVPADFARTLERELADLKNAGGLPLIRSEAIRNLRDEVCGLKAERDQLRAECERLKGKADECWGAANYRLKYLGCLFRALGMTDDEQMENRVSDAAEAIRQLRARVAELEADKARLDWIAGRASTELVHFAVGGWAIIKPTGGDMLHDLNIHDLRQAIDAAREKGAT